MLEVLDLRDNKLIRNIPSEAETMQSLKHLDILCFLMANELDFVQMFSRFNRELLTYLDPQFLPRT